MQIAKMKVEYVDRMGDDLSVVNAARVSFDKSSDWEEVQGKIAHGKLSERDVKLIRYLAKHNHWSPFAHTSVQLRVKAPIFVARQLVKHQVGGVWNEVSRRYVDDAPEFYFPDVWQKRPEGSIKQGSGGDLGIDGDWAKQSTEMAFNTYARYIEMGMAPEQARMILPQNTMTEWIWTGSLQFFARVCKLRLDAHAQQETQEIAKMINDVCSGLFPVSWKELMNVSYN